jgi:hypothetical protein
MVMACVGNDDDLRSVCLGPDGAFATMAEGSIFVDHTTVSAAVTRELYEAARVKGIAFVDAPVSGGQAGAENGQLSIMCGGDQADFDRAAPVMAVYSKLCRRIGESGAGQMTKMCNQIAIAGLVQGLSKRYILPPKLVSMAPLWWKSLAKALPAAGKCPTAMRRCWTIILSTALLSIGCARIWEYAWRRPMRMARVCP